MKHSTCNYKIPQQGNNKLVCCTTIKVTTMASSTHNNEVHDLQYWWSVWLATIKKSHIIDQKAKKNKNNPKDKTNNMGKKTCDANHNNNEFNDNKSRCKTMIQKNP
jgi:hypothetical protein